MSVQAMSWALQSDCGTSGRKMVLMALANCHNHHTGVCIPSLALLAEEAELNVRQVQYHLKSLEELGLIQRVQRYRADGSQTSNAYVLACTPETAPPGAADCTPPVHSTAPLEPEVEPTEELKLFRATEFNLLWDACDRSVQKAPGAKSPRAAYAKLVREMLAAGWTPDLVERRARAYKAHPLLGQGMLTVAALAKWGEDLEVTDTSNLMNDVAKRAGL